MGHRRQARAPPARPSAQRADPHRARRDGDHVLQPAVDRWRQRHHRAGFGCRSTRSPGRCASRCIVLPPLVFVVTKRICLGLQRRDREKLLHGRETGIIKRPPARASYIEVHEPRRSSTPRWPPRTSTDARRAVSASWPTRRRCERRRGAPEGAQGLSAGGSRTSTSSDRVEPRSPTSELEEGQHHAARSTTVRPRAAHRRAATSASPDRYAGDSGRRSQPARLPSEVGGGSRGDVNRSGARAARQAVGTGQVPVACSRCPSSSVRGTAPVYSTTSPILPLSYSHAAFDGAHAGAAVADVGPALRADRPRRGVEELTGVRQAHRVLDRRGRSTRDRSGSSRCVAASIDAWRSLVMITLMPLRGAKPACRW